MDDDDEQTLFPTEEEEELAVRRAKYFQNPNKRLLDNDASLIPGSPFSKPATKRSLRPAEPLTIAKYASTVAFLLTMAWVGSLLFVAIWNPGNSVGRTIIEVILALLSFMGLFWNSYYIVSSIFKCFIPAQAFKTNTKYCSIIPEQKLESDEWLEVTIQIPVYKESLLEVLMPTLKSCQASRDYYIKNTNGVRCNIVICDDGMMNFLKDNFAAAEMLWETICQTQGRVLKLGKLIKSVPRASRRHLKGLRSKNVYEVFHRMLYYYHYDIGFVARSTIDRRGKFKKASNLNSHLRLALGAAQVANEEEMSFEEALLRESHMEDGSRYIMFGNDVRLGHLICVNDADARMAESVILKTVPEFLNDKTLGFTQHATKTMVEQRKESYYTRMLTVYTDALYQGHFLLSSILGCHPPLVGHSIFLRTEAVQQCGRMRNLRSAYRWLNNIGLPFLPVDQVGFSNLSSANRIEYWSESHVSEDFELMIHLYNLGFNGRYCAYPDCEFQEGITRTFDEEAGRHRKFALGAHELVFNSFQDMIGQGVFTPLFRTFLSCAIPSYYKIFLTAYLCSYASGGAYLIVFVAAAITRIFDSKGDIRTLNAYSPASIIILNIFIYYILGYITFLISLIRMHTINKNLLFPEYRRKWFGSCNIIFTMLRYCLVFQFFFYSVASLTFYFLGSMDHMLSRPNICGATNKDSINISRCEAFWDMARFNSSSWAIACVLIGLSYLTVIKEQEWDFVNYETDWRYYIDHFLFAGPATFLGILCFVVPIFFNPYILGWPFLWRPKPATKEIPVEHSPKTTSKKDPMGRKQVVVDIGTFMNAADQLESEIERKQNKPDIEIGSLHTTDLQPSPAATDRKRLASQDSSFVMTRGNNRPAEIQRQRSQEQNMFAIRENVTREPNNSRPQQHRHSDVTGGGAGRATRPSSYNSRYFINEV